MPQYLLKCSNCGKVEYYMLAIVEEDTELPCSRCGSFVSRKNNRTYDSSDAPTVVGSTVVRIQETKVRHKWKNAQTRTKKNK